MNADTPIRPVSDSASDSDSAVSAAAGVDVGDAVLNGWFERKNLALLTDFYQVTMMGGYWRSHKAQQMAAFEYFFRKLPPHSGFAVAAGLESFLDFLENLRFTPGDIAYLRSLDTFPDAFLDALKTFRFSGNVFAVPEGSLVFPGEPIVRVEAPLIEAQLCETFLLNALNYPTLIATKAARVCFAAQGEPVLEFGLRRAHGPDGGVSGARAAYIGGCAATSNVLAGRLFGIPVKGTQAHSWVMSFADELSAFRAYAEAYPDNPTLLVDTYDTIESGVPNAIAVFRELRQKNPHVRASIRLDSGDLAKLSKQAHALLVEAGFDDPQIVASSELDEDLIADIKRQGGKINAWGVGTRLIVASDYPALGGVFKLVAIDENGTWQPRIKISSNPEKMTDPGRKRIVRYFNAVDEPLGDILVPLDADPPTGHRVRAVDPVRLHFSYLLPDVARHDELLVQWIRDGRRIRPSPRVADIRAFAQANIAALAPEYRRLRNPEIYRVGLTESLADEKRRLIAQLDG